MNLKTHFGQMIIFCLLVSAGCTQQAWYEGFQEGERQKCYQLLSQNAIQDCIDNVNSMSYYQYQREQEKLLKE